MSILKLTPVLLSTVRAVMEMLELLFIDLQNLSKFCKDVLKLLF